MFLDLSVPPRGRKVQKSDFLSEKVKVEPKVKVISAKTLLRSHPTWIWEKGFQKNHSIMYGAGVPQRMPGKILLTVPTPSPSKISYICLHSKKTQKIFFNFFNQTQPTINIHQPRTFPNLSIWFRTPPEASKGQNTQNRSFFERFQGPPWPPWSLSKVVIG